MDSKQYYINIYQNIFFQNNPPNMWRKINSLLNYDLLHKLTEQDLKKYGFRNESEYIWFLYNSINNLNNIIYLNGNEHPKIVYRGINMDKTKDLFKVGRKILFRGFSSTTTDYSVALNFANIEQRKIKMVMCIYVDDEFKLMEIKSPAVVFQSDKMTLKANEKECLLPAFTYVQIVDAKTVSDLQIVKARVIHQDYYLFTRALLQYTPIKYIEGNAENFESDELRIFTDKYTHYYNLFISIHKMIKSTAYGYNMFEIIYRNPHIFMYKTFGEFKANEFTNISKNMDINWGRIKKIKYSSVSSITLYLGRNYDKKEITYDYLFSLEEGKINKCSYAITCSPINEYTYESVLSNRPISIINDKIISYTDVFEFNIRRCNIIKYSPEFIYTRYFTLYPPYNIILTGKEIAEHKYGQYTLYKFEIDL